jgi:putative ABC transport system substrate-binding protein
LTVNNAPRVTALAAKHRLPAIYLFRLFATNGGLSSYGPDLPDLFFRAGGYVGGVRRGDNHANNLTQNTLYDLIAGAQPHSRRRYRSLQGMTANLSLARWR